MNQRLKTALWMAALLAVVAGCFVRVWARGDSLVPTDLVNQLLIPFGSAVKVPTVKNHFAMDAADVDYPWTVFWQQTVREGQLPLWNPLILGGQPAFADNWTAVLSPFKLLLLLLPAERAFSLGIILQMILAAVFMFALLREFGRSDCAAFVGAIAYGLNSCFLMWYWRVPATLVWAPLVVLLFEWACRRQAWKWSLIGGLVLGVALLCGSIQQTFHIGFLAAGYFVCAVWLAPPGQRRFVFWQGLTILTIAVLLAVVQLLPAVELMARDAFNSTQVRGTHASLRHSILGPMFLSTFAFPQITGTNESYDLLKIIGATRGDFNGYLGLVPFAMAVVGVWRNPDRRVRTCLWMIVAVFAIVFCTPLIKFVYHRFFVVAVFGLAILAAFGVDKALEEPAENRRATRRILATGIVVCLAVAGILLLAQVVMELRGDAIRQRAWGFVQHRFQANAFAHKAEWFRPRVDAFLDHYRLTNPVWWMPLVGFVIAAGAWWGYDRRKLSRNFVAAVFVLVTVVDLGYYAQQVVPQIDLTQYPLRPSHPGLTPVLNDHGLFRTYSLGKNRGYIVRPNLGMLYGLSDTAGNFSLAPEDVWLLPSVSNGLPNRLLDLQNVKYVLAEPTTTLPAGRFDLLWDGDGLRVFQNRTCLPRAQWIARHEVIADRAALQARLAAADFDLSHVVLLEHEPPAAVTAKLSKSPAVRISRYTPLRVTVEMTAPEAGFLLLADTWYPGWRATVDGRPAELLRADYVLRAVPVPAGQHQVEFIFSSATIRWGAVISGITLLGVIVLLPVAWRSRPRIYNGTGSR